ncbi:MAG TPA: hypothetical protein VN891_16615, partial [Steroidobacteraceae bacterium]|nr:hypothetical protein [Steroidobacteraceae bacterium]
MRIPPVFAVLALLSPIAFGAVQNGSWSLGPSDQPGSVEFSLQSSEGNDHYSTSSTWKLADLRGLDWAAAAKHDVSFAIARDAGTVDCKGFVQDQRGAGLFTFQPNPQYRPEMAKLGFEFDDRELFSATLFDVSFDFARTMKSAAVRGLDAGKLLAFRIHGVTPQFVRDLR